MALQKTLISQELLFDWPKLYYFFSKSSEYEKEHMLLMGFIPKKEKRFKKNVCFFFLLFLKIKGEPWIQI
jgi:hypothetical protein